MAVLASLWDKEAAGLRVGRRNRERKKYTKQKSKIGQKAISLRFISHHSTTWH